MKKSLHLLLFFSIFLISCNENYDEIFNEIDLKELKSFEYEGYIYYMLPHINMYYSDYNEIKEMINNLDSYGIQSWFIPSIGELQQAARNGLLIRNQDWAYVSSSKSNKRYLCLYYWGEFGWNNGYLYEYDCYHIVCPMIKMRK